MRLAALVLLLLLLLQRESVASLRPQEGGVAVARNTLGGFWSFDVKKKNTDRSVDTANAAAARMVRGNSKDRKTRSLFEDNTRATAGTAVGTGASSGGGDGQEGESSGCALVESSQGGGDGDGGGDNSGSVGGSPGFGGGDDGEGDGGEDNAVGSPAGGGGGGDDGDGGEDGTVGSGSSGGSLLERAGSSLGTTSGSQQQQQGGNSGTNGCSGGSGGETGNNPPPCEVLELSQACRGTDLEGIVGRYQRVDNPDCHSSIRTDVAVYKSLHRHTPVNGGEAGVVDYYDWIYLDTTQQACTDNCQWTVLHASQVCTLPQESSVGSSATAGSAGGGSSGDSEGGGSAPAFGSTSRTTNDGPVEASVGFGSASSSGGGSSSAFRAASFLAGAQPYENTDTRIVCWDEDLGEVSTDLAVTCANNNNNNQSTKSEGAGRGRALGVVLGVATTLVVSFL